MTSNTEAQYVLGAVDGSGSSEWRNALGTNSHVYQFYRKFSAPDERKFEHHGPGTMGLEVKEIASKLLEELLECVRSIPGGPIVHREKQAYACLAPEAAGCVRVCLVGHSRGGLIVAWVANELNRYGIPVYFMGLYDAVDRTFDLNVFDPPEGSAYRGDIHPDSIGNVAYTVHALRDPSLGSRSYFSNTANDKPEQVIPAMSNGMHHTPETVIPAKSAVVDTSNFYEEKVFMTSHGGIGGDMAPKPVGTKTVGGRFNRHTGEITPRRTVNVYSFGSDMTCVPEKGRQRVATCLNESRSAGQWVLDKAKEFGLPFADAESG